MSMASQPVSTTLTEALISRTEDVETGVVRGTKVGVKQTGKTVKVDQYCFARANFYIEQSQQYFKGRKLTRYVYFSKFLHYAYVGVLIVGLVGAPFNFILAFLMMLLNIPYLIMFIQHMYVNIQTMRHVRKQPGVPDHTLSTSNAHLEITLEEFAASYAASQQAGLGLIVHGKGTVKIQVFTESAKTIMNYCFNISLMFFMFAILEIGWCLVIGIAGIFQGGGVNPRYRFL